VFSKCVLALKLIKVYRSIKISK